MGKRNYVSLALYLILIIYALVTFFPFLWAVSASFKTYREITGGGLNLIPQEPTLQAYRKLFLMDDNFLRWVANSFFVGIVGTTLNVLFNSMAGYALARINFRGKDMLFYAILASIMVPGQVLLIPNYLIVRSFGMLNSYNAVILPVAVNATYIFMMRQFFINFPKSLEEAAALDGLNRLGVFFRIAMPLAKPAIATQAVFIFLGFWNEFLRAKLYLADTSKYTLTVGIQSMMSRYSGITQWDEVMAASVISLVPILILYILLNKYFMESVRMDGEK
ncbi:carbohydrate ABC transporter permease [Anaerobranca gottschalkii]|uniref:Carbohydrate ABC transporter membrane protein 2, CUT1 family (TC 3.A.1.1.-) n=1 Tax=Anaerobranca gottschalkii DSM 13577 TaxID=1120990 RepID=A0A1H9YNW5_9FIRM|nr:carbohydrate ABC transporter permease [Anaerobranca gottschalkii]SES70771.1 carbohydrate ABC transporter membrane protein 2, CUT1 family (TC 3.A.1.1.-) [Anaerobranca gottschalkii DSM 13577]